MVLDVNTLSICGIDLKYFTAASVVVQEFQAFELLRSGSDRAKYLLVKEAKIIAMTCTHAALKRRDLVDIGFQVKYAIILT